MQKVIRHAKYCAFYEGRQKPKISRVSILQRRVFYRKIRKIWTFADSWKFARRPAGTLEGLGFSPKEASQATIYRSSFSCSRCIDCVFSGPIPHWGQIGRKRIFDSIAASKLRLLLNPHSKIEGRIQICDRLDSCCGF